MILSATCGGAAFLLFIAMITLFVRKKILKVSNELSVQDRRRYHPKHIYPCMASRDFFGLGRIIGGNPWHATSNFGVREMSERFDLAKRSSLAEDKLIVGNDGG